MKRRTNIIAIAYYWGDDPVSTPDGRPRREYYEPWLNVGCYTDGILEEAYTVSTIRNHVRQRKSSTPTVTISMTSSCPGSSGTATITINNISNSSISGTLHFLVKERHVDYPWGGMPESDCVNRGMIPDHNGEPITIAAGGNITKEREFTIESDWKKDNCRLVAFLQKSNKEIVEGCRIKVNEGTQVIRKKGFREQKIEVKCAGRLYKIITDFQEKCVVSVLNLQGRVLSQSVSKKTGVWYNFPGTIRAGAHIIKIKGNNINYVTMVHIIQ